VARRTDEAGIGPLRRTSRVEVLIAVDGTPLALFPSRFVLENFERDHPDVRLDRLLTR
jgi:hypothetical protein